MSGTGKSSVIKALRKLGYVAVDTDYDDYCLELNGKRLWNETKIQTLLTSGHRLLFVSGCVANRGKFYSFFDRVVLLSAPKETILERVQNRSNNQYGKALAEQAEILSHLEEIEPLLRAGCHLEINTALFSVEDVVQRVLLEIEQRENT